MTFRKLFLRRLGFNTLYLLPFVGWLVGNGIGYALTPYTGWVFQPIN